MSTERPQHTVLTPNSATLIASLDAVEAEPQPDRDDDIEVRTRKPPTHDDPPLGASRNLGGECPRCGSTVNTRMRAHYSPDEADMQVRLTGYCENLGECGFSVEATTDRLELSETNI